LKDYRYIGQHDIDWRWEKVQGGEKLILTHIPSGKTVESEILRSVGGKSQLNMKKRDLYESTAEKLEKVVNESSYKTRR
jgi:hypothetical protein